MAYNETPEETAARNASILTQVAFKAAVDAKYDVTDEDGAVLFEAAFAYFRNSLNEAVSVAQEAAVAAIPAPKPPAPRQTAERATQRAREEFDATDVGENYDDEGYEPDYGGFAIKVVGEQKGALPDWLIDQCEAAGVSRVFDNRPAQGNRPWFKEAPNTQGMSKDEAQQAKYDAQGFWPPKANGGGRRR